MQTALNDCEQIEGAVAALHGSLGFNLCAVYLHGSAVSGELRPQSDIDLLAVANRGLSENERATLLSSLLKLSGRHPPMPGGPRCLEVIVFSRPDLSLGLYPARAEFVFGEWLRDAFEAGETAKPTKDAEFTLVLAQARQEAIGLVGPNKDALLPVIPMTEIRNAMRDLLPTLLEGLREDTRNVLLTLARIWHTAENGAFVSKDEAASWAMSYLSNGSALILDHARRAYLGEVGVDWNSRQDEIQCLAEELRLKLTKAMSA